MTTAKKTTTTKTATAKTTTKKATAKSAAEAKPQPEADTPPKAVVTTDSATTPETPAKEGKKATTPGVRAMKTRPYMAGVIIAKHGLAAGVTKEMVEELDKEYGHANPAESLFCLHNAWHAARGYSGIDRHKSFA
ncbi:MAG: hypothetical protein Tsb009_13850 [Planctomycetaceae bacterium]